MSCSDTWHSLQYAYNRYESLGRVMSPQHYPQLLCVWSFEQCPQQILMYRMSELHQCDAAGKVAIYPLPMALPVVCLEKNEVHAKSQEATRHK